MAGYECTDQLNCFGNRVDFLEVTDHLDRVSADYRDLSAFRIKTVREGIQWSLVEKTPYHYNWKRVEKLIRSGIENQIQQVWDLCHFGFPDDLTPLHPMFARRFAALCKEFVRFYRSINKDSELIVTPINEVSFLSWLGGDVRGTSPYCLHNGWEVKYALMRAYIEGIEALKREDSNVRILLTEPLVNVVPPLLANQELIERAKCVNDDQFQVFDILSGKICPELGGKPEYLDIIGCNYYYNNQWVVDSSEFLPWVDTGDPRWMPLSEMMKVVHERYGVPLVLSETSHPGVDKASWVTFIGEECSKLLVEDIPLWGVCWYPIIDRPDWDHFKPWYRAGLWDLDTQTKERILDEAAATALHKVQSSLMQVAVM
jgi:hypothetical protein